MAGFNQQEDRKMAGFNVRRAADLMEEFVAEAGGAFKDARTAWQFVLKVRELERMVGIPRGPGDDGIPDWVAELPGGSYDLKDFFP